MKRDHQIIQKLITFNSENTDNHMVLIFLENGEAISVHLVKFPKWFRFYDSDYKYYPICHN
jgi:hypothetical protein